MDNSPIPTDRPVDVQQTGGHVSIDTYILLAVLAVIMLTVIVQIVLHLKGNTWLLSIVTVIFIIAALCCVAIAAWRATVATQQLAHRRSVSMSAALGSFLSGLFTVVFADDTVLHDLFIIIGICLVIVALCVIGGIILSLVKDSQAGKTTRQIEPPVRRVPAGTDAIGPARRRRDTVTGYPRSPGASVEQSQLRPEYASQNYREPVPAQGPAMNSLPPGSEPTNPSPPPFPIAPPGPQGVLNIMPTEFSGLPSLFEGDELYAIPRNTKARLFIITKSNDILENCEDACAVSYDETRFALCDGVSASKFARPWARLLALEWVAQPLSAHDAETLDAWLEEPRQRWQDWVNNIWFFKINARNRSRGRVEFTQADVKKFIAQGAATTFLGLTIDRATSTWSAVAIGDTCLFHFSRTDAGTWRYKCFPLEQSSDFTDSPAFITTRPHSAALAAPYLVSVGGEYKSGDILVMATDALAMWLLTQLEREQLERIITLLGDWYKGSNEMFAEFVRERRREKQLTDDDTTLIIIH